MYDAEEMWAILCELNANFAVSAQIILNAVEIYDDSVAAVIVEESHFSEE